MKAKPIFEACVETLEQAILAEKCGADRIELCSDLSVGGLTPNMALIREIQKSINIPVMAMARPRSGDFVHSNKEQVEIKKAIDCFKQIGIRGVVLGFLTRENKIDLALTQAMVTYAFPLEVTFHKAIDLTPDPIASVKELAQEVNGLKRILTSGGLKTAYSGRHNLKKMIAAAGERFTIIAAGKVTNGNWRDLHQFINAKEYHGRRIVF